MGPVLADVACSNPASGTYRYYTLDYLGSTNGLCNGAKAKISALAYTPYGASYSDVGPSPLPRYTGYLWDDAASLYLAPTVSIPPISPAGSPATRWIWSMDRMSIRIM